MTIEQDKSAWIKNAMRWERLLINRAQNDQDFRAELLENPVAIVLRELNSEDKDNITIPSEVSFLVHENTSNIVHLIQPPTAVSELDSTEHAQVFVHENADNIVHFVIPVTAVDAFDYDGELTDDELEMVAGGTAQDVCGPSTPSAPK